MFIGGARFGCYKEPTSFASSPIYCLGRLSDRKTQVQYSPLYKTTGFAGKSELKLSRNHWNHDTLSVCQF